MRVLIVEDDEWMAKVVADALAQQSYVIDVVADGQAGWEFATATDYDLIVLDITLPQLDGISLCRKLRQEGYQTPILLLTAKDTRSDKVTGLDAGADDYVAKPFDFQELLARIRALLRRGNSALPPVLEWGALRLDPSLCEVTCDGEVLHLTRKEYGLLELFLRHNQRIFSPSAIIEHLWAFEDSPKESTIKSHVKALRQKLKAAGMEPDCIETVYGMGYRLKPLAQEEQSSQEAEATSIEIERKVMAVVAQAQAEFKAKMGDRLAVLEQTVQALFEGKLSSTLQNQAEQEAHKLAGALGTFGLAEGSRLAEAIEDLLQIRPLKKQNANPLQQLVNQLYQVLEQTPTISGSPAPVSSSVPSPEAAHLALESPFLLIISQNQPMVDQWVKEVPYGMQVEVVSNVTTAGLMEHGLSAIVSKKPDVILLDLDMNLDLDRKLDRKLDVDLAVVRQTQDNLQFLSALSQQLPSIPVLVWTDQTDLTDRLEVVRHGGRGFLHKSMSAAQVMGHIAQVLQSNRLSQAKILIVDDDPQVLSAVHALLQPWGMELTTLDAPQQFCEVLTNVSPDLLILDVKMPGLDGIELCQVIRTDPRWSKLPVLFLTAHADTDTVEQIYTAKADDCVSKSLIRSQLITRIFNCLERSSWLQGTAAVCPLAPAPLAQL
ncbi:MAG: response regulator [Elainellaceae cyanobacterium]